MSRGCISYLLYSPSHANIFFKMSYSLLSTSLYYSFIYSNYPHDVNLSLPLIFSTLALKERGQGRREISGKLLKVCFFTVNFYRSSLTSDQLKALEEKVTFGTVSDQHQDETEERLRKSRMTARNRREVECSAGWVLSWYKRWECKRPFGFIENIAGIIIVSTECIALFQRQQLFFFF